MTRPVGPSVKTLGCFMIEVYAHISNFLRLRREQLGLTQEQVAKKADVSKATLWKLENFSMQEAEDFNVSLSSLNSILTKGLNSSLFELFASNSTQLSIKDKIKNSNISDKSLEELLSVLK